MYALRFCEAEQLREEFGLSEVCDLSAAPTDGTLNQFYRMFDEPSSMPDPVYGNASGLKAPETNANKSGITGYVFFDKPCIFNGFAVYDTFGTGGISVYDANTDKLLWRSDLGSYMSRSVTLTADSAPTDCLKIVKEGGDMNELTFYGYEAPSVKSWDVDKDGDITILDATAIQRHLADLPTEARNIGKYIGGVAPTMAPQPTAAPTAAPTQRPTQAPTQPATQKPTAAPTQAPTKAPSNVVTLDASATSVLPEAWYAWTWGNGEGRWVKGNGSASAVTFTGLDSNVVFVRSDPGKNIDWNNGSVWNKTDDQVTQYGGTFVTSGWNDSLMTGSWS